MANDLLKNPQHRAKLSYNGFQMHQKADFTMSIGQLIPIYYDFLQPGDKFTAQAFMNIRTQPLEQAANMSAKVRLDWFVVPLEQLFKYFGQLYYGIQDISSDHATLSALSGGNPDEMALGTNTSSSYPRSELYSYLTYLLGRYTNTVYTNGIAPYNYYSPGIQANDSLRLMDALGYPISNLYGTTAETQQLTYSLWLPMAYQKIYYDYYRLTDRQANNPIFYNFDTYINSTTVGTTKLDCLFRLRYIPYAKDFRTNTFVSPLQGAQDIGSIGNTDQLFNNWLTSARQITGQSANNSQTASQTFTSPTTVYSGSSGSIAANTAAYAGNINTANIRSIFAVEKALEITRRASKHYDAQTLAHWGVKPPTSIAGEVFYLGSQNQPFVIGDVVSTAASGNEPLGTIAGKGYSSPSVNGSSNAPVKYDGGLNCHAIIMCIACIQPEVTYTQRAVDKLNMLISPKDFIHPEFDNLGMQPYYWMQYHLKMTNADQSNVYPYGWQYAYSEFKMKQNRVFGGVHNEGSLYHWVPQFDADNIVSNGLPAYLCTPDYLNNALVYPYNYHELVDSNGALVANWYYLLYVNDPFICHAEFNCSKASKMSKYSLVNL